MRAELLVVQGIAVKRTVCFTAPGGCPVGGLADVPSAGCVEL